MFLLHRPSTEELDLFLATSEDADLTYPDAGAIENDQRREGYANDSLSLTVGPASAFEKAADGLRRRKAHEGAGVSVFPATEVTVGATHINLMRLGLLWVVAPVRIVYVIDEPDRYGWAYGTLPGHPEKGEELFEVRRTEQGTDFHIRAFSRPVEVLARAVAPISRQVQRAVTSGYLKGLKAYTEMG